MTSSSSGRDDRLYAWSATPVQRNRRSRFVGPMTSSGDRRQDKDHQDTVPVPFSVVLTPGCGLSGCHRERFAEDRYRAMAESRR